MEIYQKKALASLFVSVPLAGAYMHMVDADGEIVGRIALASSDRNVSGYRHLVPVGGGVMFDDGIAVFQSPSRHRAMAYGEGATRSGANPDFVVTAAGRFERELKITLGRLKAKTDRQEAQLALMRQKAEQKPAVKPVKEPVEKPAEKPVKEKKPVEKAGEAESEAVNDAVE